MKIISSICDKKAFYRGFAWFVVAYALMYVSKGMFAVVFPLVAIAALSQKRHDFLVVFIFVMTVVFNGNSNIVRISTISGLAIRLAFFAMTLVMAGRIFAGMSNRYVSPLLGILPYLAWETAISPFGWSPIISYLKLLLFFCIFIALYGVACSAASAGYMSGERQRAAILSGVAFIILGSVFLIPFPGIGMMRPEDLIDAAAYGRNITSLFKGILDHSQALGPVVAVLVTLVFCDMLFTIGRWSFFHLLLVVLGFVLIFKTSSRTAMGSMLAGIGMASWLLMQSRGIGQRWKGKVVSVMSMVVILFVCMVFCVPGIQRKAASFLLKFDEAYDFSELTMEELTTTRQGSVDIAMYNFRKKPLTGNGFQVAEYMIYMTRNSWKDYLTAPVEKGVWVTAVLEEGGVVGFVLFAGFLLIAFFTFVHRKAYIAASILFTMAVVNMGEFTLFSMTSTGGIVWSILFFATVMDAHRNNAMTWRLPMRMM